MTIFKRLRTRDERRCNLEQSDLKGKIGKHPYPMLIQLESSCGFTRLNKVNIVVKEVQSRSKTGPEEAQKKSKRGPMKV